MAQSNTPPDARTRQEVVESLRQVFADLETGKLRGGGWREQYGASAIGLLGLGLLRGSSDSCGAGSVNGRTSDASGERYCPNARTEGVAAAGNSGSWGYYTKWVEEERGRAHLVPGWVYACILATVVTSSSVGDCFTAQCLSGVKLVLILAWPTSC